MQRNDVRLLPGTATHVCMCMLQAKVLPVDYIVSLRFTSVTSSCTLVFMVKVVAVWFLFGCLDTKKFFKI